jgi:HK97 family phage prohead protease
MKPANFQELRSAGILSAEDIRGKMNLSQFMDRETRVLTGQVELRAADGEGEKPKVRGYAAVFNKESENLGSENYQFREIIEPGAFSDVLQDDVRALLNHDPNFILARSKGGEGTLSIGQDERGLWYEFDAPDTQAGRDLMESIRRGDIDQSSFSFTVAKGGQEWKETEDSEGRMFIQRTVTKVARLYDVSPVTYPAYPDATVALRSLQEFQAEHAPEKEPEPAQDFITHRQRAMDLIDKTAI